ncbi:MAG: hypothetical protein ACO3AY_08800, partial [Chitinophagaceae bacterium]
MILSLFLWLFPLFYLISFAYAVRGILNQKYDALFVFFLGALPIYITSLSILHSNGLDAVIPFFQYSKEILVVVTLGLLLYRLSALPRWNWLDRIMILYFVYTAAYIFLPIGSFGWVQKIIAFKNISIFPLLYFIGRFMKATDFRVAAFQKQNMLLAILAALLLIGELVTNTHFQTATGYASFYDKYFLFDPAGNYGLS